MRLTAIVTIVLRIYALLWLIEGIVQCLTAIVHAHQGFGSSGTVFSVYGIWMIWIVMAIVVFFLSQPIARIAVPPPNEEVKVGTLTRYDLYCFAFTFLGLYFFLSSIGDAFNAVHYYMVSAHAPRQELAQQSEIFYRLTRPLLTSIAGLASLLLAPKLAHKLSSVPRPTFPPESAQPTEPS